MWLTVSPRGPAAPLSPGGPSAPCRSVPLGGTVMVKDDSYLQVDRYCQLLQYLHVLQVSPTTHTHTRIVSLY